MKLWIKYLIASALGVAFAFILPFDNKNVMAVTEFLSEMAIRFGRYMVIPVVFFTAIVAFNRLRENKLLLKTGIWSGIMIVASALILSLVGLLSILIVRLPRIPIATENVSEVATLGLPDLIRSLFPYSAFETMQNGSFLLASFLLAILLGTASTADENMFKPIVSLSDSLSKLLYNISVIFTEFLPIGMVAISCLWTVQFRLILSSSVFVPLIIMLLVDFVVVVGIIYPLIVRYLCHDSHPYRILYAAICSIVTAFFSGDANFVLQLNIRHGKESLGIRRRINGAVFPLFSIFQRGGSALVTIVSFIVIWRSYSSLNISVQDVLWITFVSFGLSFLLGGFSSGAPFISLSVLCSLFGRGFENGFLLLKPASLIICSFASAFDAVTAIFASYIVGVKTKLVEHHGVRHYI